MSRHRLLLVSITLMTASLAATAKSTDLRAELDSLAVQRACAGTVEGPIGRQSFMTLPSGRFLIEWDAEAGKEFLAWVEGDSVFSFSRGVLRAYPDFRAPSTVRVSELPAQMASDLRSRFSSGEKSAGGASLEGVPGEISIHFSKPVAVLTTCTYDPADYTLQSVVEKLEDEDKVLRKTVYIPAEDFDFTLDSLTGAWLRKRYPDAFVPRIPHTRLKKVHGPGRLDLHDDVDEAIVVVLDAANPRTPELMERVRATQPEVPLIWAFCDTKIEDILALLPLAPPSGETAVSNALGLKIKAPTMLRISHGVIKETTRL